MTSFTDHFKEGSEKWWWRGIFGVFGLALLILGITWGVTAYNDYRVSNDTRFSYQGEAVLILPPEGVVEPGGVIQFSRPEVCNDGLDLAVGRWAELELDTVFAINIGDLEVGFVERDGSDEKGCVAPSIQTVPIPDTIPDGSWRLRFENSWISYNGKPKTVVTYTPYFTVKRS